jgi:hypothetical protein
VYDINHKNGEFSIQFISVHTFEDVLTLSARYFSALRFLVIRAAFYFISRVAVWLIALKLQKTIQ